MSAKKRKWQHSSEPVATSAIDNVSVCKEFLNKQALSEEEKLKIANFLICKLYDCQRCWMCEQLTQNAVECVSYKDYTHLCCKRCRHYCEFCDEHYIEPGACKHEDCERYCRRCALCKKTLDESGAEGADWIDSKYCCWKCLPECTDCGSITFEPKTGECKECGHQNAPFCP